MKNISITKSKGSNPIEITTIKANYLTFRLLAFFILGLGMDLGREYLLLQILYMQSAYF
jgi:hypoxanthine-guanine phosphoribosyltransferase